jgi:hypothetical protein
MGEPRYSYSRRRTEQRAKDIRDRRRQEGLMESAESEEERAKIEAFFQTRGINLSDGSRWAKDTGEPDEGSFRSISTTVKNLRMKEIKSLPLVSKPQPKPEAKSLKAAYLREIAMAARRRGLIKDTYSPEEEVPTVKWGEEWDAF